MAVIMMAKDYKTDSFYIASNGGISNIPFDSPLQYMIQKFDKFYVVSTGHSFFSQKVFSHMDLNSLSYPLTKEVLYKEFYLKFLELMDSEKLIDYEDGAIDGFSDDFIFIQDGKAFDVFNNRIHEFNNFGGAGRDSQIAYLYCQFFYESKDPKDLVIEAVKRTIEHTNGVNYPIQVVNSKSDVMEFIEKDGTVREEKLECNWRVHG